MLKKIKSLYVIKAALKAKNLGCCLEYCRSMLGKLAVALEAI